MNQVVLALWFFLPAGIANVTPLFVSRLPLLKHWNMPIDGGLKFRGKRLLGANKTWRGLIAGTIMGAVTCVLQSFVSVEGSWITVAGLDPSLYMAAALGILLGFGALGGDAVESFFKRQVGVDSGRSWFPFDQLDYVIGGSLLSGFALQLSFSKYLWITVVWFGMHLLFSYIGYLLRFKSTPI